jgi:hypothetical protein
MWVAGHNNLKKGILSKNERKILNNVTKIRQKKNSRE